MAKIVLVDESSLSFRLGRQQILNGKESSLFNLAIALKDLGHQVVLISNADESESGHHHGIDCFTVGSIRRSETRQCGFVDLQSVGGVALSGCLTDVCVLVAQ